MTNDSKHKYSTIVLLFILGLGGAVILVSGMEGLGTKNYIPKFLNGDTLINSSIYEDNNSINVSKDIYINGDLVCTVGSACGGTSSGGNATLIYADECDGDCNITHMIIAQNE